MNPERPATFYTDAIKCIFLSRQARAETFPNFIYFCLLAKQPPVGQGLLIHEISRSYTTTQHSV